MRSLHEPWELGGITIPNRVVLAPLAGIGNWFVRLQAKRYGAGLAVSEMVSSHAIHYRNRKTLDELLVVHPDERAGGPGGDPAVRPGPRDHALRRGGRGRARRRPDRPQHGLPGAEGDEDRRGRGADLRPGHRGHGRARRARGLRPPGHGQAARGAQAGRRRGLRGRAPARRGRRCRRPDVPPALGGRPPQGHAGLRAGDAARAGAAGAGDRLRRHGGRGARPRRVRVHRLRGGDAGARRARQPVAVRAGARHAQRRADARGDPGGVALGARPRRRAPRPRPRRPLPAQVPPLVRRAARRGQGRPGGAPAGRHDR